ncbi:hypothetical protein [Ferruginivarius sediminum]|uniref:Lipoprotein n=1 Tax=Ferruginivarius sediminum TaxID=2661937 RepID=A0A369TFJ7_9PROT|nr:hypothetical protein [Ferruginivarius sediminum]RDD63374.1 hypothetical protein DRB17_02710 [Ferruginivarius sediminum]
MTVRLAAALMVSTVIGLQACSPKGHEGVEARLKTGSEPQRQALTAGTPGVDSQAGAPGKSDSTAKHPRAPDTREARLPKARDSKPEPAAPDIDADPDQFIGASPRVVAAQLGSPAQIRREPPAEIWQYRMPGCVLDLFVYPDQDGKSVTYLEARDLTARPVAAEGCLERLMRARLASKTG